MQCIMYMKSRSQVWITWYKYIITSCNILVSADRKLGHHYKSALDRDKIHACSKHIAFFIGYSCENTCEVFILVHTILSEGVGGKLILNKGLCAVGLFSAPKLHFEIKLFKT